MKYGLSICAILLLTLSTVSAQVASHAPTILKQAPAQRPATQAQIAPDKPVARVNGSILTNADLVREEYSIFPYARQHNGIPEALASQIRDGALKMMIFEELVYQDAQRRKLTVPKAKMQRAEVDFRKQFATPAEFNALLQSEFHGSEELLRAKILRSLLIDAYLKTEIENKATVSPADVRAYFEKNPTKFAHAEQFTFQTISVLLPANATADQLKNGRVRAEQALKQAKATKTAEEFGLLAEKISDDDYRVMMGQHKPIAVDQLPPQAVKALRAMKTGEVSDLIQIDQAYTIMRLQNHTPAGESRFEDVKAQLQNSMQQNKRSQLSAALDKKLHLNAKIEVM